VSERYAVVVQNPIYYNVRAMMMGQVCCTLTSHVCMRQQQLGQVTELSPALLMLGLLPTCDLNLCCPCACSAPAWCAATGAVLCCGVPADQRLHGV
jgi:hypothetical protein